MAELRGAGGGNDDVEQQGEGYKWSQDGDGTSPGPHGAAGALLVRARTSLLAFDAGSSF